jgi:hypothetical protein
MRRVMLVLLAMASLMGGITHAAIWRKLGGYPDASPTRLLVSCECTPHASETRGYRLSLAPPPTKGRDLNMSRTANLRIWAALLATVAAAAMMVLGFTSPAQAAYAGDLDESFGGYGRVVFDVFGGVDDSAQALAIQPDGKIVLAGSWCGFGAECNTGTFALTRFNPDGSLDKAFGSGGRTLVAFPNGWAKATDVAIQENGSSSSQGRTTAATTATSPSHATTRTTARWTPLSPVTASCGRASAVLSA